MVCREIILPLVPPVPPVPTSPPPHLTVTPWPLSLAFCPSHLLLPFNIQAAMSELEVLDTLRRNDPQQLRHCCHVKDWFYFRGHVCMIFDKHGPSLFDFLRKNGYRGFPLVYVQTFARQLLEATWFLRHLGLCHTDLKPENILCAEADYAKISPHAGDRYGRRVHKNPSIRVIDFGNASTVRSRQVSVVATRHYRAPEVILGLGLSFPCDMWALWCILVELYTGDMLYATHDNV